VHANNKIDYVYILGASHSGSTLLALLLNAHPEITTIGETAPGTMGDINTYRCSCGRIIKECPFWKNIIREMRKKHPEFDIGNFGTNFECTSNPIINRLLHLEHRGILFEALRDIMLRLSPSWKRALDSVNANCRDLVHAVLASSGGRIFIDSSKIAHRLKFLLRIPEFNIRIIHIIRDGRAVALTYMRQDEFGDAKDPSVRRGGRGMQTKAVPASMSMERAADEWRRCIRSAEYLLSGLDKSRWIQIKYEELCTNTEKTLGKIYSFLGVNYSETNKEFRSVSHHVIGNGMRLDTTSEVLLDERWKSILSKVEREIFERIAGAMNQRYGYD